LKRDALLRIIRDERLPGFPVKIVFNNFTAEAGGTKRLAVYALGAEEKSCLLPSV
jgi:hypothetical protein